MAFITGAVVILVLILSSASVGKTNIKSILTALLIPNLLLI